MTTSILRSEATKDLRAQIESFIILKIIDGRPVRQLDVTVQTRAKKNEIKIEPGPPARMKLKIKSPPVDGKANTEIIRFLSEIFDIPQSRIQIVSGEKSKQKTILLD